MARSKSRRSPQSKVKKHPQEGYVMLDRTGLIPRAAMTLAVAGVVLALAASHGTAQQPAPQPAPVPFAPASTPDQEKLRTVPAKRLPGLFGDFPDRFPEGQVKYVYLELERKVADFAPAIEIPLAPFPGTTGVARAEPGQYSSVPPGRYAGNLDIRDFKEGASLYVPI